MCVSWSFLSLFYWQEEFHSPNHHRLTAHFNHGPASCIDRPPYKRDAILALGQQACTIYCISDVYQENAGGNVFHDLARAVARS